MSGRCDGDCGVFVHQSCYDIDELPEGEWFCDVCALRPPSQRGVLPQCALCRDSADDLPSQPMIALDAVAGGSSSEGQFVHWTCMKSVPVVYELPANLELGLPRRATWDAEAERAQLTRLRALVCTVCKEKTGVKARCCHVGAPPPKPTFRRGKSISMPPKKQRAAAGCCAAVHPLCAVRERLLTFDESQRMRLFCEPHAPALDDLPRTPGELVARHTELLQAARQDGLLPLVAGLLDRKKLRPSLLELLEHCATPNDTLLHELARRPRCRFGSRMYAPQCSEPAMPRLRVIADRVSEHHRVQALCHRCADFCARPFSKGL